MVMLQPCGLTVGSMQMSGSDLQLQPSWLGGAILEKFSGQIYFFFKSSELVENDEAHSDLTEELDW